MLALGGAKRNPGRPNANAPHLALSQPRARQGAYNKFLTFPNDPQRKSDTDTRVDPKTSPVPRLEGNPTFVPKGSSKEEPFGRWPQITNFAIPAPTCLRNAKLRLRYRLPRQVRLNLSDPLANWLVDPVVAYRAPLNFYRVHSLPRSLPTPADLCPWRIRFYPPAGSLGR